MYNVFSLDNSNGVVYYYSTLPQVYELVSKLDPEVYEKRLCRSLLDFIDSIANQMRITVELTDKRRTELVQKIAGIRELPESYLHVDNGTYRAMHDITSFIRFSVIEHRGSSRNCQARQMLMKAATANTCCSRKFAVFWASKADI